MTGRLMKMLSPVAVLRLAIILAAAAFVVVMSNGAEGAPSRAAACKCFVPNPSSTWASTDPGSHPDRAATFDIGVGPNGQYEQGGGDDTNDYNFGGVVGFTPTAPADADIPDGAILSTLQSTATLAILNNPCTTPVQVPFTLVEGTTDITNTVDMLPFGVGNELGPMAGDNPPYSGQLDVKPSPDIVKYPAFLNAIFDPDWVDAGPDKIPGNGDDNNGPAPPIKPRLRAVGNTWVSFATLWVVLQTVFFEPGTKLPQLPAFDAAYGYPSVTVLQTSSAAGSATPPLAGPITDFCAPLKVNIAMPGVTQDNPDIPGNEGGVPLLTLPDAPGTEVTTIGYYLSQRDADGDGYENALDSCPLNADTVWDPRALQPQPADNDAFAGQPSGDGISDTCDPSPTDATPALGSQPTDYDGDGYPSRGDNCPLVANGKNEADNQGDHDKNAAGEEVGDGIGDACDPNPGAPDGAEILCVRLSTITVGGPTTAATSPCLTELPPPGTTAQDVGGGAEGGAADAAGAGAGTSAGRGSAGGGAAGGAGGPASGVGSLSPVGGSVPAWAAIAAALGAAGVIGSAGTMASRLIRRRRNS